MKWVTKKPVALEREEEMFAEPDVLPESDEDRPLPPQGVAPPLPVPFQQLHTDFEIQEVKGISALELMKNARRRDVAAAAAPREAKKRKT